MRWKDAAGQRKQKTFPSRGQADLWCAEITKQRAAGTLGALTPSKATLEDLAVEWLAHSDVAPSTLSTYRAVIEPHIMRRIGSMPIARINRSFVMAWQADLKRDGISPDRRGRALMYLRMLLDHAVLTDQIAVNPTAGIKKPKVAAPEVRQALSPKQVEQIAANMDRAEDVMLLRLLAYAGLRPGEIGHLRWEHVQQRTLIVRAPKTNRVDVIDLLEPLAKNLAEFRLLSGSPDMKAPIVHGPWAKYDLDNWRKRIFNAAASGAGWGKTSTRTRPDGRTVTDHSASITPYNLRHSYASLLIAAGRPVTYVAQQMRHSVEMTMRTYAHLIADIDPSETIDPAQLIREAQGAFRGNRAVL